MDDKKNIKLHQEIICKWVVCIIMDAKTNLLTSSPRNEGNSEASSCTSSVGASLAPLKLLTLLAVLWRKNKELFTIYHTRRGALSNTSTSAFSACNYNLSIFLSTYIILSGEQLKCSLFQNINSWMLATLYTWIFCFKIFLRPYNCKYLKRVFDSHLFWKVQASPIQWND